MIKKAELTKKSDIQTCSPSRKSVLKATIRHPRPTQHHACVKRKPTGDLLSQVVCNVAGKHGHWHVGLRLSDSCLFDLFLFVCILHSKLYKLRSCMFMQCL